MKIQILNIKPINFRAVVLTILFGLTVSVFVFAQEQGEAEKHFNSGKGNFDQKKYDQAIEDFDKAIALDAKLTDAYRYRGISFAQRVKTSKEMMDSDMDKALADLTKAVELDPQNAELHLALGGLYFFRDAKQAVVELNKAIELNPKYAEAYKTLGFLYQASNDYDKAIANYSKAIENNPKYIEAYRDRAMSFEEKGDFKNAIADWNKFIELEPSARTTYLWICRDCVKLDQLDRAITSCTKAIELNKGRLEEEAAYETRAEIYLKKKQYAPAIADYTKAMEWYGKNLPFPVPFQLYQKRADIYATIGKYGLAIADYTKAIKQPAGSIEKAGLYKLRSLVYRQQGKIALAKADERKQIELLKKAIKETNDLD